MSKILLKHLKKHKGGRLMKCVVIYELLHKPVIIKI